MSELVVNVSRSHTGLEDLEVTAISTTLVLVGYVQGLGTVP